MVYAVFSGELSVKWPGLFLLPWCPEWVTPSFQVSVERYFGNHDEIVDACLLQWYKRKDHPDEAYQGLDQILQIVTNSPEVINGQQYLTQRLQQGHWQDPNDWLESLMQCSYHPLAIQAIQTAWKQQKHDFNPAIQKILADPNKPIFTIRATVKILDAKSSKATLLALTDLIHAPDHRFLGQLHSIALKDADHPLIDLFNCINDYAMKHSKVQALEKNAQKHRKPQKSQSKTFTQLVQSKLKEITKQDFGDDAEAWKQWIETYWETDQKSKVKY